MFTPVPFLGLFLSKSDTSPVRSSFQGATNESLKKSLVRQQPRQLFCTSKRPAYFSSCCQMEAASPSPHNGTNGTAPSLRLFFSPHLAPVFKHPAYFFLHCSFFSSSCRFPLHRYRRTSLLSLMIYQLPPLVSASSFGRHPQPRPGPTAVTAISVTAPYEDLFPPLVSVNTPLDH